jgi:hypothetical protein
MLKAFSLKRPFGVHCGGVYLKAISERSLPRKILKDLLPIEWVKIDGEGEESGSE